MICYKSGYKYQLTTPYSILLPEIIPERNAETHFMELSVRGLLSFRVGYAWDGPSGPTVDTPSFMRGSLVHDGLYQMMRLGLLDLRYRKMADEYLRKICLADNMSRLRTWWVMRGLQLADGYAARSPEQEQICVGNCYS